ncbi:MAG: glycosyltransferase family 4 protein [Candidatus Brocadia sp.]|nr:glycosyltransferase family 4 protein [Candidatus Brocadia sp.]
MNDNKIRVVMLGTRGFPNVQGGIEKHCEHLSVNLVKLGCNVIVLTRKPYIDKKIKSFEGVRFIALPTIKNKYLETFFHTFIGIVTAFFLKPDILHVHGVGPSLFIPLARLLGLNVVMTNHGPDYQRKKWNKFAKLILRLGESAGSRWAHEVICISEFIANHIKEKYCRDVNVITNGMSITEIPQTDVALRKYNLEKDKYILAVGRLVPEKGFHDLIDAFNLFQLETQNWKLVIVGCADHDDKYSLNLKEKASKNKDIIMTSFLGEKPLHELYAHAGLFVLPSYYEGMPIVLFEALSHGLPCIVSNLPSTKSLQLPDDMYFVAGDVNALSQMLKKFINKPRKWMNKNQINQLLNKYDWYTIAIETMCIYKRILGIKSYTELVRRELEISN